MTVRRLGGCDPILCAPLLRRIDGELIRVLRALSSDEWHRQTIVPGWKVCDVAAHLLDTALRKLSLVRDAHWIPDPIPRSSESILDLVNRLNREGVAVYRRLSPALLIEMMTIACEESAKFHESLDPFGWATFNVSWAGEERSLNWFDTARELTERWHHQQQIRLATERPGITTRELYHPVLDCFLRALPHAYRDSPAAEGTSIVVEVTGDCGGHWAISKGESAWKFICEWPDAIACKVMLPQAIAWRAFTKGIDREAARRQSTIEGRGELSDCLFELTAIVG